MLAALLGAAPTTGTALADNVLRPEQIPAKARELANKGRVFHDAGDYTAAIAAFKEAYVLAPSPGLLFNIAQAYRLAGHCDDAAWMYRRFLDTNPGGENRELAEQHLASVEKCGSGGLRVTVVPPKLVETIPLPSADPSVTATTRVPIEDDRRPRAYKRIGTGAAITGGAALAGAAYFALQARVAARTVEDTYKRGGKWSDVERVDARGKRDSMIATALGIGGGVAMASGLVLYGLGHHYEKAQRVAVVPSLHGAQISLSWGF
jgi:tetratricopeptide (TPR) repeat protein